MYFEIQSSENRILRRIFGPKRDENGECRRLYNEELHSLYRSANIVRESKMGRSCSQKGRNERRYECFQNVNT